LFYDYVILTGNPERTSWMIYTGRLAGDTDPVEDSEDSDVERRAVTDAERRAVTDAARVRKERTITALLSGERVDGSITATEVLDAAGDYKAEGAIVELLSQQEDLARAIHEPVLVLLRTYHLVSVIKFLRKQGGKIEVTEAVLKAVAENGHSGKGILGFLLDRGGNDVQITEELVKAAARNQGNGKQIMELLLDRKDQLRFTEEALKAANEWNSRGI
jgi:GNAT superfamily N-acetyltransferase